ncbi:MAG: hypothetical protein K2J39_01470 [Ruminococcus sp.]|nr:hypothetical protein [Ruminococcus sp.]
MVTDKNTKQEILDEYKRLVAEAKAKKITVPADAKGITSKNNKTEMLNAVRLLEDAVSDKPVVVNIPVPTVPKPEPAPKPATEPKSIPAPVKKNATATTATKSKEDNDLSYLNQEIVEKIQALDTAKSLKKAEYNNILAVEQELVKFVEMINRMKTNGLAQAETQKSATEKQTETIEKIKADSEESNKAYIELAEEKRSQLEAEITENKKKLENERAVEEEAYSYKVSEENKKVDDAWSDEVIRREEKIAEVEEKIAELNAEIDSKAELKKQLESKLAELPELIKKAQEEGAIAKEKELGRDYGYKSSKAKKETENNVQALQEEIEMLRKDFEDSLAEKQAIQAKLDKAYELNNALYMQTVQSTGGVKILNNSDKS